jgi:hypothetical protein
MFLILYIPSVACEFDIDVRKRTYLFVSCAKLVVIAFSCVLFQLFQRLERIIPNLTFSHSSGHCVLKEQGFWW